MTTIKKLKTPKALHTNVALKVAMALTGLIFVSFILIHMYGNLKLFAGKEAYNGYAEGLRTFLMPILPYEGFLWIFRVTLALSIVIHMGCAFRLWHVAGAARGSKYAVDKRKAQTYAARTMRWGGVIIAAFIVFHILQFTTLHIQVGGDYHKLTPYERVMVGFSPHCWYMVLVYGVVLLMAAMHVRHGVFSALATLGLSTRRREKVFNLIAYVVAGMLFFGFMAPPLAIVSGLIS